MKIASFSTNGYPSEKRRSLGIFTHEQAKAMAQAGAEVEVFDLAPSPFDFLSYTIDFYEGIKIHRIPAISIKRPLNALKTILKLRKVIHQGGFSIILCSFLDSQYLKYVPWILSSREHKLAFVVHGRDAMIPHGSLKNIIKRYIKRYLFKKSSICFPVSEYTETLLSCLICRTSAHTKKIQVVYNGINREVFSLVNPEKKNDYRKKHQMPTDHFILITVCQLIKRKGVDILIKGVMKSLEKHKKITHIIIGNGEELDNLKRVIQNSSFQENFIFKSNLTNQDLAEHYAASDLYAMISKTLWDQRATEGFGISYIEASYMGLPVICGKDGGGTLAVQNNFTGYWIDPNNIDSSSNISEKINLMIESPDEYQRLAGNGKIYTDSNFSWESNAKTILKALQNPEEKE